jgi:hypothetical protein
MVSLLTLDQSFGVRIPVSQPLIRFISKPLVDNELQPHVFNCTGLCQICVFNRNSLSSSRRIAPFRDGKYLIYRSAQLGPRDLSYGSPITLSLRGKTTIGRSFGNIRRGSDRRERNPRSPKEILSKDCV